MCDINKLTHWTLVYACQHVIIILIRSCRTPFTSQPFCPSKMIQVDEIYQTISPDLSLHTSNAISPACIINYYMAEWHLPAWYANSGNSNISLYGHKQGIFQHAQTRSHISRLEEVTWCELVIVDKR